MGPSTKRPPLDQTLDRATRPRRKTPAEIAAEVRAEMISVRDTGSGLNDTNTERALVASRNIDARNGTPFVNSPQRTNTTTTAFVPSQKIKLVEDVGKGSVSGNRVYVILDVTPEMSEAKNVQYIEIAELCSAASLLVYLGSPSRTFSINAKLISRNQQEATENFRRLHAMKSWAQPDTTPIAGATRFQNPRIIRIYAYGNNIKGIPTVMKSITVDYPSDCDYITTNDGVTEMPIICAVTMTFQESRTSDELSKFDIIKYKQGTFNEW